MHARLAQVRHGTERLGVPEAKPQSAAATPTIDNPR